MAAPKPKSNQKTDKKNSKEKKSTEPTVGDLKAYLRKAIMEHAKTLKREKMLDLIYMNRGLGVGNMKSFTDEFENGFNRTRTGGDKSYYGENFTERPKLKKVSTENVPSDSKKDEPKTNNKSKK